MARSLELKGTTFRDAHGRHLILRGVNLGGDSKMPTAPDGRTHLPSDFSDHRTVSFVGRPAPLDELDRHLDRLRHWGFNCLRLLTTWEAVEHADPGVYDAAYLDYFAETCRRAGERGMYVFVDFHQDVWSRMSGGSGAPGWTWEAAGLDFTKFHASGAALAMQHVYDHRIGGRQDCFPQMSWAGNYARPANGIIWTLFFAGADFAPSTKIEGRNIQHFLQDHYLGSMRAVAERVEDLDNVIGFDTLNEPGSGYIGKPMAKPIIRGNGLAWTALDGLAVASGMQRDVPLREFGKGVVGSHRINPGGVSIWLPGHEDPFRAEGAWDVDGEGKPVALDPDYFVRRAEHPVCLQRDYVEPFFQRVADTVRDIRPDWLLFAEVDPVDAAAGRGFGEGIPARTVNASHWYDLSALLTKRFDPDRSVHVVTGRTLRGEAEIEESYFDELGRIKRLGDMAGGGVPTLIGEFGIPYDLSDGASFERWARGDRGPEVWDMQTVALDLMYNVIDRLLLSSTQWNYSVGNRNDPMIGDGWNQEDLSIWSTDQLTEAGDLNSGGRALEGFCRPYVRAAQGTILSQAFDRRAGRFRATIDADPAVCAPTMIFVPGSQFPNGFDCKVEGSAELHHEGQLVILTTRVAGALTINIVRK